jgi:hypothetical protein
MHMPMLAFGTGLLHTLVDVYQSMQTEAVAALWVM